MNIDKHIDETLAMPEPEGLTIAQFKLWNICKTYLAVRPVLKFVRGLLFFKPKWQKVLDLLIAVLDEGCPNPML
jgi:hypothetical protein